MRKGKLKNVLAIVLIASMALFVLAGCGGGNSNDDGEAANDEQKTITIGFVNWAECIAASNLWKNILEGQGYSVELKQLDVAPLYVGLSEGDIDLFFDAWLPITHGTYWDKYQDDLLDCGIWYESPAKIGIVVPSYVDIDSIEDLNDSSDKFNDQIIGIDPGAGIMKASDSAIESYGLTLEVVQGSEAAMLTSLKKAYENNEWIAVTGWSPHWMFSDFDLKYLDDPNGDYGEEEEVHLLANAEFAEANPELISILKNFRMDDNQLGSLEKLINDGMDPEDAAVQWSEDNQAIIDEWIKSEEE